MRNWIKTVRRYKLPPYKTNTRDVMYNMIHIINTYMFYMKVVQRVNPRVLITRKDFFSISLTLYLYEMMDHHWIYHGHHFMMYGSPIMLYTLNLEFSSSKLKKKEEMVKGKERFIPRVNKASARTIWDGFIRKHRTSGLFLPNLYFWEVSPPHLACVSLLALMNTNTHFALSE